MQEKLTVEDLLGGRPSRNPNAEMGMVEQLNNTGSAKPNSVGTVEATLREVVLIVDPSDCEILDGKVVITKRIIAHSRDDAMRRFGLQVRSLD